MANEQTSVPLYAASEILTAANMNISAGTGVPVFATTVTRDAAFGGASEKVLAEGQLCYLSSTNVVQYYDGAAWATVGPAAGAGLVCVKAETAFTSSTSITADNVFTSTFTNYFIIIRLTTTGSTNLSWALRVGGVTAATNYNFQKLQVNGTAVTASRSTSQTKCFYGASSTEQSSSAFILSGPNLAERTTMISFLNIQGGSTVAGIETAVGDHTTATAYDGIELTGGTATGVYAIYGYSKTV